MFKTLTVARGRVAPVGLIAILLVGQGMASMDSSILAVASPALRANLHASDPQLQLVLVMYTVVFAAFVIIGARLGELLGRRRMFLAGLAGFTLASLAGGLAPTPVALIVARAVQGAGGALMTPQVLSTIQLLSDGRTRARAIGAYSMVLAVGVAAGQIAGGLIVGAQLLSAAWRPALLLNVPVGTVLLLAAWRWMPVLPRGRPRRLDYGGATLIAITLGSLVLPLTLGRAERWPTWVWPCLATCAIALTAFIALERHLAGRDGQPLFDVSLMRAPGVAAGSVCVLLVMGCYAGFLISLTLYLQGTLRFSALHAGLTFAVYACGFAIASLTWTRATLAAQLRLPVVGPLAMGASLLTIGWIARGDVWPTAATTVLLASAGAGHACGFSPLTSRMAAIVRPAQAADLSGLVITASLTGQILGVAGFAGVYLSAVANGSGDPLAITTDVLAATLLLTGVCACGALGDRRWPSR